MRLTYVQAFETISNFCFANELGDAVVRVLQNAMQEKDWHEKSELVDLIARQVARETADGKDDVWSDWSVGQKSFSLSH